MPKYHNVHVIMKPDYTETRTTAGCCSLNRFLFFLPKQLSLPPFPKYSRCSTELHLFMNTILVVFKLQNGKYLTTTYWFSWDFFKKYFIYSQPSAFHFLCLNGLLLWKPAILVNDVWFWLLTKGCLCLASWPLNPKHICISLAKLICSVALLTSQQHGKVVSPLCFLSRKWRPADVLFFTRQEN